MKKVYRTALGKSVDIDSLRLANENVIAIGNMKVNARGDELGPGGEVVRTRNEVMDEYYKLHGSTVNKTPVAASESEQIKQAQQQQEQRANAVKPRGSAARRILEDQDGLE